jgi:hypothetical protein
VQKKESRRQSALTVISQLNLDIKDSPPTKSSNTLLTQEENDQVPDLPKENIITFQQVATTNVGCMLG